MRKNTFNWTFADGSVTTVVVSRNIYGALTVIDKATGEDLDDVWSESDFMREKERRILKIIKQI